MFKNPKALLVVFGALLMWAAGQNWQVEQGHKLYERETPEPIYWGDPVAVLPAAGEHEREIRLVRGVASCDSEGQPLPDKGALFRFDGAAWHPVNECRPPL